MDDRVLIKHILKGDQQAFRTLIAQHQRLVAHMVGRLVDNHEDREELCQDVFLKVYSSIQSFKFDSKLSTWIATIAYRMSVNYLRKHKSRPIEEDLDKVSFTQGVEDRVFEKEDYSAFIQKLVQQMPFNYRNVLTLFYLEGFSYPEIVKVTGMPEGTVKNYLFRAKKKLKELSEPYIGSEIEKI